MAIGENSSGTLASAPIVMCCGLWFHSVEVPWKVVARVGLVSLVISLVIGNNDPRIPCSLSGFSDWGLANDSTW